MHLQFQHIDYFLIGLVALLAFVLGRQSRVGALARLRSKVEAKSVEIEAKGAEARELEDRLEGERTLKTRKLLADLSAKEARAEAADLRDRHEGIVESLEVARTELEESRGEVKEAKRRLDAAHAFVTDALRDWNQQAARLPYLRAWSHRLRVEYDAMIERDLQSRRPPAFRAAEHVKQARAEARESRKQAELLEAQLGLYESLAPWLVEYSDLTVEEILDGIREEEALRDLYESGEDPAAVFVPAAEWSSLSESERNQLALDRYWHGSRRRTAWVAGIQYERFIGYRYETEGYRVEYQGALRGVEDLGIDLVCIKGEDIQIVQCKRLSAAKGIPVRENVVAQIFGASKYYSMDKGTDSARPVLYTTFEVSDTARQFANFREVELHERVPFESYPCIKCNVSKATGERIFHLPFDQQYDATVIGDSPGEFYAMTVAEAEKAGYRRAFRWRGGG